MPEKLIQVLLIEDNDTDALLIRESLKRAKAGCFALTYAESLADGLERLDQFDFDAVLLDLKLPDSSGVETLIHLRARRPRVPVLVLTGNEDEALAMEALQVGAQDYLLKGEVVGRQLAKALLYAIQRKGFEDQILDLNASLERRVAERTAQLEAAYRDLEDYSSMVSHQLKDPLQLISGYAQILTQKYADQAAPEDAHGFKVICDRTKDMGETLDLIMNLAMIGQKSLAKADVDMASLVRGILVELDHPQKNRRPEIIIDRLPRAHVDPAALREVWINLVTNGIKYSRRTDQPRIRISGVELEDEIIYTIEDNGVGFDMAQADRLFGVFQRLHDKKDFEGTGLGLAIVHKAITLHGGRIWAESRLGEGATFHFALPKNGITPESEGPKSEE